MTNTLWDCLTLHNNLVGLRGFAHFFLWPQTGFIRNYQLPQVKESRILWVGLYNYTKCFLPTKNVDVYFYLQQQQTTTVVVRTSVLHWKSFWRAAWHTEGWAACVCSTDEQFLELEKQEISSKRLSKSRKKGRTLHCAEDPLIWQHS